MNYELVTDFDHLLSGFRKTSDGSTLSPAAKRRRDDNNDTSLNMSTHSFNSTLNNTGQWEIRIIKADLIEANTKVSGADTIQ